MTTITGTTATSTSTSTASALKNSQMSQTDFLSLLTAQLKEQDPFNPMSNSDMVAQMATITNSQGIAEMNTTLKSISSQMSDSRMGSAASWIGRSMLVTSNIAAPNAAGDYAGQFTLANSASNVSVDLVDGSGNVVKTIDMGARDAGDTSFYWDGHDDNGNVVANTPLQVQIRGASPSSVATWASVAAVQSPADGSASKLITALGSYAPSDALKLA